MKDTGIHFLTMPKWGLAMKEGKVIAWLVEEGTEVHPGVALVDIETEKILSSVEATGSGVLRRKVAGTGDVVRVGGLLGVIADPSASDSQLEHIIQEFHSHEIPDATEKESLGPTTETVDVDGYRMCYLKRGKAAESAILIHGFGGDLNTWMFNHEALAATHSVYAIDLPGHGRSSKQVGDGTLLGFANALKGFMDSMNLNKAHIVGHSLGGAIGILFALHHPNRCSSLVLIASAGLGPEIDAAYIRGFISSTRRNELRPQLEKLFADSRLITRQLVDDTLKYKRLDGVDSALRTIASQFCPSDVQSAVLRDRIVELQIPVLVLWGSEDRVLPVSQALNLPDHVRTEILSGYGHMLHMEAASKVNMAVRSFWQLAGHESAV